MSYRISSGHLVVSQFAQEEEEFIRTVSLKLEASKTQQYAGNEFVSSELFRQAGIGQSKSENVGAQSSNHCCSKNPQVSSGSDGSKRTNIFPRETIRKMHESAEFPLPRWFP